jgi:hypothetical protein
VCVSWIKYLNSALKEEEEKATVFLKIKVNQHGLNKWVRSVDANQRAARSGKRFIRIDDVFWE